MAGRDDSGDGAVDKPVGAAESAEGPAEYNCVKCGLPLPNDQHTRWTPAGYEHDICPTPLMTDLHPSGFTHEQVRLSHLLIGAVKSGRKGAVQLVKCMDLKTGEPCTVLAVIIAKGHGILPIARMFVGSGTDEVEPIVEGEKPQIVGRQTNG